MLRLLPKEVRFVEMFGELGVAMERGAILLRETLRDPHNAEVEVETLKSVEHEGDQITHAVMTRLNQTFITPFDREDIHRLAASMDDVLDLVYDAGERLVMYRIEAPSSAAIELSDLIVKQCGQIRKAVGALEAHEQVLACCIDIKGFENDADRLARAAIANLFERERDPIALIKLKELYETLETATDKAEDVANVLETIVLKGS
jgi:predicted phosphate transport protein (TIGR00153 family)